MQKRLIMSVALLTITPSFAGTPVWTFTPLTPTTLNLPGGSTAIVRYNVTNQSRRIHNLILTPVPGITQDTSAGNCPAIFRLAYHQSCVLTLNINGLQLTADVMGGPSVCESGSPLQCYQPALANQLNITRQNQLMPSIAAGGYLSTTGLRPLVALLNANANWIFPSSVTTPNVSPPPTNNFGNLVAAACSGATCITSGYYYDASVTSRPLLALSKNGGTTWTFPAGFGSPTFTPDNVSFPLQTGALLSNACSGNLCVTTGSYQDSNTSTLRPLLAYSQNGGASWLFPSSITNPIFVPGNPFPFAGLSQFSGVSCVGSTCVATGSYSDGSTSRPMSAISNDAGTTWVYPAAVTDPIFTPNNSFAFAELGFFYSASCVDNLCMTAGEYTDNSNVPRPLLAYSSNAGATWVFPSAVVAPVFTPATPYTFDNGTFESVSCSSSTCVAVGFYEDTNGVERPLVGVSRNGGLSWIFPASVVAPVLSPPMDEAAFVNASCSGNTCVAVGTYIDVDSFQRPLLAVSQDAGSTWVFPPSIVSPVFTPDDTNAFEEGVFESVNCLNGTCLAAGYYVDINGGSRPLIAVSSDNGSTWTYPSAPTSPVFTPNNTNAFIEGGVSASSVHSLLRRRARLAHPAKQIPQRVWEDSQHQKPIKDFIKLKRLPSSLINWANPQKYGIASSHIARRVN